MRSKLLPKIHVLIKDTGQTGTLIEILYPISIRKAITAMIKLDNSIELVIHPESSVEIISYDK